MMEFLLFLGIFVILGLISSKASAIARLHNAYRGRIRQARQWAAVRWSDDPKTAAEVGVLLDSLQVPTEEEEEKERVEKISAAEEKK